MSDLHRPGAQLAPRCDRTREDEPNPMSYRLPVADPPKPVCAKCQHRADAKVQDPAEPWRSWFCLATTKQVWPEQYNPITGETRAAVMGHERCVDMNGDGQCTKFSPMPNEPPSASYESASWGRVLDDAIEASQRRRVVHKRLPTPLFWGLRLAIAVVIALVVGYMGR